MLIEARDRNEYLTGEVVYYFDHDIPIKSPGQFLKDNFLDKSKCNWGEFIKTEDSELLQKELGFVLLEAIEYIVPFFHSTKMIAATDKAEYKMIEDFLESGCELDSVVNTFYKYCGLPLWVCNFKKEDDSENETALS